MTRKEVITPVRVGKTILKREKLRLQQRLV
jgi:hypothetical protein